MWARRQQCSARHLVAMQCRGISDRRHAAPVWLHKAARRCAALPAVAVRPLVAGAVFGDALPGGAAADVWDICLLPGRYCTASDVPSSKARPTVRRGRARRPVMSCHGCHVNRCGKNCSMQPPPATERIVCDTVQAVLRCVRRAPDSTPVSTQGAGTRARSGGGDASGAQPTRGADGATGWTVDRYRIRPDRTPCRHGWLS